MKPNSNLVHICVLSMLGALSLPAQTITDNFTDPTNWGTPILQGGNIGIGSGRMNYTSATTGNAFAAIVRNAPMLSTTQDWSLQVNVHLDQFTLSVNGQFSDVFLGIAKSSDPYNTRIAYEFGRGRWGSSGGYYITDGVLIGGVKAPPLFGGSNFNVSTTESALRIDYNASNHTITYYFDVNGGSGGYNWVAQGTANIASGTYNLNMGPSDSFLIFLNGSSQYQTVSTGQAYWAKLQITQGTPPPPPAVATGIATNLTDVSATLTGTVNPNGLATSARFDYGLTTAYCSQSNATLSPNNGSIPQTVSVTLSGLQPATTYHYRTAATNSNGSAAGNDATFTTMPRIGSPVVSTGTATNITEVSATLTGVVNPSGLATTARFQYGLTAAYGSATNVTLSPSNGAVPQAVSVSLGGLQPATIYHFRLTATNEGGSGIGNDATLATGLPSITVATNNGSITITRYTGSGGQLVIPALVYGLPVTSIGDSAFNGCSGLASVTIPNSVTNIGDSAFKDCSGLANMTLPGGVTTIGNNAFYSCSKLTSMAIPNSVTSIGDGAFANCSGLTSVAFPNSVISIGNSALSGCSGLTSVTIPNSVISIGNSAFNGCSGLTSVTIPNSVISIGDWAFAGCSGLADMALPDSVTSIGSFVFYSCSKLTSVAIPNSVTSIGRYTFHSCSKLTSVAIPDSITSISEGSFIDCSGLTNIIIPNSITSIGDVAFYNCSSLTNVAIPDSASSIGNSAFLGCSSLANVTIGNTVTSIGSWAFRGCSRLTSLGIPNSVATIGDRAFETGSGLVAINVSPLNANYGSLDGVLFNKAQSLLIRYPGGKAGNYTVPTSVTSIKDWAFSSCSNLTSVTIGNGTTSIGDYAFYACAKLQSALYLGGAPGIGYSLFDGCTNICYYIAGMPGWGSTYAGRPAYAAGAAVAAQPVSQVVTPGGLALFSVVASGIPPLEYCWRRNGSPIAGATQVTFAVTECQLADSGSQFSCLVSNAYGSAVSSNALLTVVGARLCEAVDACELVWTTGGAREWTSQTMATHDGVHAVQSGLITHSQESWLQTTVQGPGTLTFWWSVSSEVGHDFLQFYTNGLLHSQISGAVGWNSVYVNIGNGTQTLRWRYMKSDAGTAGLDRGWLDQVAYVAESPISDFTYTTASGKARIISYNGSGRSVSIPSTAYSIPVDAIGDLAFYNKTNLASVTIPKGITSIGSYVFHSCPRLTAIIVDPSNANYSSLDGVLFNKSQSLLIQYPEGKPGSYILPNSVARIGSYAFGHCLGLTNVSLGNSLANLGDGAFYYCSSLDAVTLPNSLTSIGHSAFYHCSNLTNVTLGSSVTNLGASAFHACSSLSSVTIPNSVSSIGDSAFSDCFSLTSVSIGNGVTSIGEYQFTGCFNLTRVFFHGNAPSLGGSYVYAPATAYYLPGRTGWGATYGGCPAVLWNPAPQTTGPSFGVHANRFGFNITGTTNIPIVVEASTNLAAAAWVPLQACTLTNGLIYFSDPAWTNFPTRAYRIRSP